MRGGEEEEGRSGGGVGRSGEERWGRRRSVG